MKDFKLSTIRQLVEESLKEKPTGDAWFDSRYNEQVHHVGHTQPYYLAFYLIANELEPCLSVELGSWQGTGASSFAVGCPGGQVITIDIHREDKDAQKRTIEAASHLPNLTYINKWTWDALEDVAAFLNSIDILFIDAWHDYELAMREWKAYEPLLSDTALVIADDITTAHNFEGMLQFWDELPGEKFLDDRIHPGIPMGFLKYTRQPDEPELEPNRTTDTESKPAAKRPSSTSRKATSRSTGKRTA